MRKSPYDIPILELEMKVETNLPALAIRDIENTSVQSIYEIFEQSKQVLLLGQTGSGKTFTLLQLAERLISIARRDTSKPIPIILNLSSWQNEYETFIDWLEERIRTPDEGNPYIRDIVTWLTHGAASWLCCWMV